MPKPICRWAEGCDRAVHGRNLCKRHYQRAQRSGLLDGYSQQRHCEECGASLPINARRNQRFCSRHCTNAASWRANKDQRLAYNREWRKKVAASRVSPDPNLIARRPCEECGDLLPPNVRRSRRFCSRRCVNARSLREKVEQRREADRRRRARLRNNTVAIVTSRDWRRLVARYEGCCAYCGQGGPMTRDHVIPIARGGSHAIGNLLPACRSCNSGKKAVLAVQWRMYLARRQQ